MPSTVDIKTEDIKKLRELCGAGMMDCKKALIENKGDIEKSVDFLRKKGLIKAGKRMGRETAVGRVFSYIHGVGNIGVLLQLNCETDFVARNEDFAALGRELSMQVAAANPIAIKVEDLDKETVEKEKAIYAEQLKKEGKKADIAKKIIEGKLKKFYSEVCLEEQAHIKDEKLVIADLIKQYISKFGENISIARFERYQVN